MKFFYKLIDACLQKKSPKKVNKSLRFIRSNCELNNFLKFLTKNGALVKEKNTMALLLENLNYFLYSNTEFIYESYPNVRWVLEDLIQKKLTYIHIFNIVINLIKPPFVVKSILIPKKLRRKTKQKYLIKIVYKNDNKRLKSSYKQLCYFSNKFTDSKFKVRLYKSMMFSFLDWKSSELFKLKSMIFKKFFKF